MHYWGDLEYVVSEAFGLVVVSNNLGLFIGVAIIFCVRVDWILTNRLLDQVLIDHSLNEA